MEQNDFLSKWNALTDRERTVIVRTCEGDSREEIGFDLFISGATVKGMLNRLYLHFLGPSETTRRRAPQLCYEVGRMGVAEGSLSVR
jgi:FixJ family two-component response regulator